MAEFYSISPFTGKPQFEPLMESTSSEVDEVVLRSTEAWAVWSRLPDAARASALAAIADALERNQESLAELAHAETALGVERLLGEIARTSFQLRMFSHELETGNLLQPEIDEAVSGPPPGGHPRLLRTLRPLGPVAVFGAGNFPFAFGQLGGDTASALAAGCTVVVKDHPGHPYLAVELMRVASEALSSAGFNPRIIQSVKGMDAGLSVVKHPSISAVGFTGSQSGGRALWDIATSRPHPIPFYGELGSANPVFITNAALEENASGLASEFVGSMTLGFGQFCTKPSLVFYAGDDAFADEVAKAVEALDGGQLLSPQSRDRYSHQVAKVASVSGVRTLNPSEDSIDGLTVRPGLMHTPVDVFLSNPTEVAEECFGPSSVLIQCSSEDDFDLVIDKLQGALVSTIQARPSQDGVLVQRLIDRLSELSGRIVVNGWPTGLAVTAWQHHGGPYPASTSPLHTSVGLQAMMRFVRPVVIQNVDDSEWPNIT